MGFLTNKHNWWAPSCTMKDSNFGCKNRIAQFDRKGIQILRLAGPMWREVMPLVAIGS